eukprot:756692-Hanusia_phi.AAC.6
MNDQRQPLTPATVSKGDSRSRTETESNEPNGYVTFPKFTLTLDQSNQSSTSTCNAPATGVLYPSLHLDNRFLMQDVLSVVPEDKRKVLEARLTSSGASNVVETVSVCLNIPIATAQEIDETVDDIS